MSGQATGWVLRHGPRPTDLDRKGVPYGLPGARSRRLILAVIADAANRDGRHSHPGAAAIEEGALYSRSTVKAALRTLAAEGWIRVEEEGGGRGRATVYALPGVSDPGWRYAGRPPETVQSPDPSEEVNGPESEDETVRSEEVNGPESEVNGPGQADPQRFVNGTPNGSDQLPGLAPGPEAPAEPTPAEVAAAVTNAAWEARTPKPTTPWIAARKIVERLLASGWSAAEVEAALAAAPTWTTGAIEFALRRARETRPQRGPRAPVAARRDEPDGRVRP